MGHTQWCLEILEQDECWVEQWPRFCVACGGYGQVEEGFGLSSLGVALGSGFMAVVDVCPDCAEQGICPRCGLSGLVESLDWEEVCVEGPCVLCGWIYSDGGRPGYGYECECGGAVLWDSEQV